MVNVAWIAIALLTYAALAWFRPRAAFAVLLALLPSYLVRFTVFGVPVTFLEGMILVLAAMTGVRVLWVCCESAGGEMHAGPSRPGVLGMALRATSPRTRNDRWVTVLRDPWVFLPLLWILTGTIAATGSPAGARAWGIWKAYIVEPVLVFWILRTALRSRHPLFHSSLQDGVGEHAPHHHDVVRLVIVPLALGAFGVALVAILQAFTGIGVPYPWSQPGQFRATSVFGYPNAVGLFLVPIAVLVMGACVQRRRALFAFVLPTSLIAILLTESVGAIAALIVGIGAFASLHVARAWIAHHARALAIGIVSGWVLLSLLLTAWLPYQPERPRTGPRWVQALTFQQWSGSVRLAQYRETWRLLRDHPIRGAGLAGYQTAIAPYHEDARVEIFLYPHNLLLTVWVDLGLLGLVAFLTILIQFFGSVLRSPVSGLRSASIAAILAMLAYGLVDVPFFKNDLAVLFWVVVGIGVLAGSAGMVRCERRV